ncbi:2-amino-4-hydroxy-6-hydroxymethyldihydropteridine diphosphokinase, partial [Campylobacter coli]|uniref:2-amino-4-hydroxy-6- hydroxymethyldihydropteridine diphosphokinase n=1 Tax=Campylobacter coli TaxID=195 RepID=UPI00382493DF
MQKIKGARRLETSRFFPYFSQNKKEFKYRALVGLGNNIEPEKKRFNKLFRVMMEDRSFKILATSPFLINEAFGFKAQKDFTNATMFIQTNLHATAFLKVLLFYELKFNIKRTFKNSPTTLELDLLYFSQKVKRDGVWMVTHIGATQKIRVIL